MRQAVLAAAAVLLTGCAQTLAQVIPPPPPAGLQLTIQPESAWAGAPATLSIYNGSAEPIGYNLCFGGLEQRRGHLWVPALTRTKACTEAFSTLEPGQQASAETTLAAALADGDYRYVTRVQVPLGGLSETQLRSESLRIAGLGG